MSGWLLTAYRWLTDTLPPREFSAADPPAWVADYRMLALPGGLHYRFRLQIWPDRAILLSRIRYLYFFPVHGPIEERWDGGRGAAALGLVERAFEEPTPVPPCLVLDGAPTAVRLFRREPAEVVWQTWNLACWQSPLTPLAELPPVVQLAADLFARFPVA